MNITVIAASAASGVRSAAARVRRLARSRGTVHSLTVTILICLFTITAAASRHASHELEELLRLADARRQEYIEAFRDLVAVETRLTEVIDQHGRTERQRTLVSDFLVYQSAHRPGASGPRIRHRRGTGTGGVRVRQQRRPARPRTYAAGEQCINECSHQVPVRTRRRGGRPRGWSGLAVGDPPGRRRTADRSIRAPQLTPRASAGSEAARYDRPRATSGSSRNCRGPTRRALPSRKRNRT
jgi:hypothetical protein